MKISAGLACFVMAIVASLVSQTSAETVQTGADVFNGRPFLWLEAESFGSQINNVAGDYNNNDVVDAADYVLYRDGGPLQNEVDVPGTVNAADYTAWRARFGNTAGGWKVVSKESPITSVGNVPLPILPATSNVSGTALLDDIGGGRDTVRYEVKFITAGTYQLFTRHSMYDSADVDTAYGNEDSIYLSPAFNKNSSTDWVGFEGVAFDENDVSGNVDIPNPGFAADPDGFKPTTGDSSNDGWYATRDWGVKSMGTVTFPNNAAGAEWNGNFNWYNRPFFVGAAPAGGFNSDFEFKTEYVVTEAMLGQTLTFEMATRENYVVMDGFLFIQTSNIYPTNDLLDIYSQADLDAGILPGPGAGAGLGAVPEPAALVLFVIGIAACQAARPRRRR